MSYIVRPSSERDPVHLLGLPMRVLAEPAWFLDMLACGTSNAARPSMKRVVFLGLLALSACSSSASQRPAPRAGMVVPAEYGRRVVDEAASCWLGGLWSDAAGEDGDARQQGIDARCNAAMSEVETAPGETYASFRAVDERWLIRLAGKLETHGGKDYVPLLHAVADASREDIRARRAADVVKRDYSMQADPSARRADKDTAAAPLGEARALGALLAWDGVAKEDAKAIGLLLALDRMEIARGLPKHLKIITVGGPLKDVFGVAPPSLSGDPAAPIPTGTWRTYLERVAAAGGHAVPSDAGDVFDRETYAWTGVLAGFADRLGKTQPSPSLAVIVKRTGDRIALERTGAINVANARKAKR